MNCLLNSNQSTFVCRRDAAFPTVCLLVTVQCIKKHLTIKPTRCTNFSTYFWNKILHVSDSSSVHHQEFFTVHTAMVYVIRDGTSLSCSQAVSKPVSVLILFASCQQNLYDIYHKSSWWWTEELSETCRVLFQKLIWEISASSCFYYRNLSWCTVNWTSNSY